MLLNTYHAWVRREHVPLWLAEGWEALESLDGTPHGNWSVHCIWRLPKEPVKPEIKD